MVATLNQALSDYNNQMIAFTYMSLWVASCKRKTAFGTMILLTE
jgi:hypothetical protein